MVDMAFTGFQALPPPIIGGRPWHEVLQFGNIDVTKKEAQDRYKLLASGCDPAKRAELSEAITIAQRDLK